MSHYPNAGRVWNDVDSPSELNEALEAGQLPIVKSIVQALCTDLENSARVLPEPVASDVLRVLRKHALFQELRAVAEAIRKNDPTSLRAGHQHAQALIEGGHCTKAISRLDELRAAAEQQLQSDEIATRGDAQRQLPEILGALGRAYKQLYVDARPNRVEPRKHDWARAVEFYSKVYQERPTNYWHGGNWIALLSHAEKVRTDNSLARSREAESAATDLLRLHRDDPSMYAAATRMEAHLARGETNEAIEECKKFLAHGDVDRFAIQSTIRQLRELWCLTAGRPPGSHLLPVLQARLAQEPGGRLELQPTKVLADITSHKAELERVWGAVGYQPIGWLEQALQCAKSVALITSRLRAGSGTGFVLAGTDVSPEFKGRYLLMTNAHVCTSEMTVQRRERAFDPGEVTLSFTGAIAAQPLAVREVFTSSPRELDVTLLLLVGDLPEGVVPLIVPNRHCEVAPKDRVNIIGHPLGGAKSVSIQDNHVVDVDEKYLWYRAPTDPGSSGSPVFDHTWNLVAIHHASSTGRRANEGIRLERILEAVRSRGLSETRETLGVVSEAADADNIWDSAHRQGEREHQYVEPDFRQAVPRPNVDEEGSSRSPKGLNTFWPPTDQQYKFGWHLSDDYSQLRTARELVGDPAGRRIRVGILDTGYDPNHVSCPAHVNTGIARNVSGQGDPFDATDPADSGWFGNEGHGTATIALLAGNRIENPDLPFGSDWLGGAPHLEIVPIRIADSVVHLRTNAIAEGIEYATSIGCRVISISMGGVPNKRWASAVNAAYERGVVIVAAAGNRFGDLPPASLVYPARFHRVIAVCGAVHDKSAYYRGGLHGEMQGCFGPASRMTSAIAAFTANMPWAMRGTRQNFAQDGGGTSAATPQVAAAAALWLQQHIPEVPEKDAWQCVEAVRHALFSTADKSAANLSKFGAGLLRAANALNVPFIPGELRRTPTDTVRFPWLTLLLGLESAGVEPSLGDEMLETEALQLYLMSQNLQSKVDWADPDVDPITDTQARELLTEMARLPNASEHLRRRIEEVTR